MGFTHERECFRANVINKGNGAKLGEGPNSLEACTKEKILL